MSQEAFDDRLRELMLRHLEGATTPDEKWELELTLHNSPVAQKEFAELLVQSVQLHSIGQEQDIHSAGLEEPVEWPRKRRLLNWAVAAALVGLLGFAASYVLLRNKAPTVVASEKIPDSTATLNGVAILTHSANVLWSSDVNADLDNGVSLSPGRLKLERGLIQLEFAHNAQVVVEGPAELKLISGDEAYLESGRLSAHVPPEARGFVVQTASGKITDLGTEFGVNRTPDRPLELDVFLGRVQLQSEREKGPQELTAGEAVRLEQNALRSTIADRNAFVGEEELALRESIEWRERYREWKKSSQRLADDPATLVHFDFENHVVGSRSLTNSGRLLRGKPAEVFGCNWTEGRWPNKSAVEFRRPGDRVHLFVPGRYQSLSYLAWVRVDMLPNYFNALSLSERRVQGSVHWQLLYHGAVEFSVKAAGSNPESGWDRLVSAPIFNSERIGRWIHLAVVYDGPQRTMNIFVNGQKVQTKTVRQAVDLTIGDLGLGNWMPLDLGSQWQRLRLTPLYLNYVVRNFHGRMDEFTLLSRPVSAEEIRQQYEVGKPSSCSRISDLPIQEGTDQLLELEPIVAPMKAN